MRAIPIIALMLMLGFLSESRGQVGLQVHNSHLQSSPGSYLRIENGHMHIADTAKATLMGTTIIKGDLYMESGPVGTASLVEAGGLTMSGTAYIERFLAANDTEPNRRYVSPAVSNATAAVFNSQTQDSGVFYWNEPDDAWQQITDYSTLLNTLQGYAVTSSADRIVTFEGALHSGVYRKSLSNTEGNTHNGFHLVGNPYPSSIDWRASAWNNQDLSASIWYRTNGTFATYNKKLDAGVNGGQAYIPPMQAFWVKVQNGNVDGLYSVNNQLRVHPQRKLYRKNAPKSGQSFRLEVAYEGHADEILFAVHAEGTQGFDDWDSRKFLANGSIPEVYTYTEETKLAIHSRPPFSGNISIPLGTTRPQSGNYTLRAREIAAYDPEVTVLLEDKHLDKQVDLRQQDYTFAMDEAAESPRFALHLNHFATSTDDHANPKSRIELYTNQSAIHFSVPEKNPGYLLRVFNITGQLVLSKPVHDRRGIIQTSLPRGIYQVTLKSDEQRLSRKVYIE